MQTSDEIKEDNAVFNDFMAVKNRSTNLLTASSCRYDRNTALCVHKLNCRFHLCEDQSFGAFLTFMKSSANKTALHRVEKATKDQSSEPLWKVLRYGRVTASVIHDIVHRRTAEGSLVERLMGATRPFLNRAMARGLRIEAKVRAVAETELGQKIRRCGLTISPETPIFAASPDGIGDDFVLEIKCPMYDRTVSLYIKDGHASPKCISQLQWQMFVCKKPMGFLVVADPKFFSIIITLTKKYFSFLKLLT